MTKRNREIHTCLGCGRDTTATDYCWRCIGNEPRGSSRYEQIEAQLPLEDDYGEEATADSVCQDNTHPGLPR
jgi:hypothetical protein